MVVIAPLDVIVSWPRPNYIDPVTRGHANIVVTVVLFPLVVLIVGLRMYTRLYISKSVGLDDWLMVAAVFPSTAFAIISLVTEFQFGCNRHVWDVEASLFPTALKLIMATLILFDASTSLTKLSMLTLSYRIIGSGSKILRMVIICVSTLVVVQALLFMFLVLFQCRPIHLYWTLSVFPQNCISQPKMLLAAGIINTITDFLVVILPLPIVWGLKLAGREQIVLMIIFGAGFIVCAAGCVRTYYTYQVTVSTDQTWMIFPTWISSDIELYLGVICASIPATKKFFSRYLPRLLGNSFHSTIDETKSAHSIPNTIEELELGAINTNSSQMAKGRRRNSSIATERLSSLENGRFRFSFGGYKGSAIASLSNCGADEMNEISRTESYDELVASANQSSKSYGAFG